MITLIAACFAVLFLMPIVLTVTNSFMASSEISSNYGQVFATTDTGGKTYISEKVNLKFSVLETLRVLLKYFWGAVRNILLNFVGLFI